MCRHTRLANSGFAILAVVGIALLLGSASATAQQPVIADHTRTVLSDIPAPWIEVAKDRWRLSYGHTSHGSQIISGMNVIKGTAGSLYWWDHDGTAGGLSLWDGTPSGDLGNPNYYMWEVLTRTMLGDPGAPACDRNMVMWSWCGQADTSEANMQIYLDLMSGLVADYPDVTFIHMTGHLNGSGEEGNLHARNNQIRDHVIATCGVLFDFANIESYNPDGYYFLDLYANDNCDYWIDSVGHNWADEWCDAHPGDELCDTCSCAHSKPLNCNLKARAFWWMITTLAGWPGDFNQDDNIDLEDFALFQACFTGSGLGVPTGCELMDVDGDDDVDLDDFSDFHGSFVGP